MPPLTRTIAGHEITLTAGIRYIASRPMASRKDQLFPVNITKALAEFSTVTIPNLTYDQANELINQFNNGATSFDGRVW